MIKKIIQKLSGNKHVDKLKGGIYDLPITDEEFLELESALEIAELSIKHQHDSQAYSNSIGSNDSFRLRGASQKSLQLLNEKIIDHQSKFEFKGSE